MYAFFLSLSLCLSLSLSLIHALILYLSTIHLSSSLITSFIIINIKWKTFRGNGLQAKVLEHELAGRVMCTWYRGKLFIQVRVYYICSACTELLKL